MNVDIEKRLHRVMIKPTILGDIQCIYAQKCEKVQFCERCNHYFLKCSEFVKFSS